jgi:alpha-amylase
MRKIAAERGKQNFFMFGEAYDGSDAMVGSYTQANMVDSAFYFPQFYVVMEGVIKNNRPTTDIEGLWGRKSLYGQAPQPGGVGIVPAKALVNFVDNHDVPRFQCGQADDRKLRVALAFAMMAEGVPCIYYGTEQGFSGCGDPSNRERLWDAGYNQKHPLYEWIATLARVRREHVALRRGDTQIRWTSSRTSDLDSDTDAGIFAFERRHPEETALVVMNVNRSKTRQTAFGGGVMQTSFAGGTVLRDLVDPAGYTVTVNQGGTVTVTVPALAVRVLVPQ